MDAAELEELKYSDLQALAKQHNVRANGGKEAIIEQLARVLSKAAPRTVSSSTRGSKRHTSDKASAPPVSTRTRPSITRAGSSSSNQPAATTTRTRSRVISVATPRAALIRKSPTKARPTTGTEEDDDNEPTQEEDAADEEEEEEVKIVAPPRRKAKETQKRLGVGRPVAAGGTGVRKSTAKARTGKILEVVVPSLQMVREEQAAAASSVSAAPMSVATSKQIHARPTSTIATSQAHTQITALQDRLDKTDAALAEERHKVAQLQDEIVPLKTQVGQLKTTNTELARKFEALDAAVLQILSEQVLQKNAPPIVNGTGQPVVPPNRPTTPRHTLAQSTVTDSTFPPTPPSAAPPQNSASRPASRAGSRPASRSGSRPGSPFVSAPAQTLHKAATLGRARALSNQAAMLQHPQPQQAPTPIVEHTLGKHGRETSVASEASGSVANPKKKRRVDDGEMEVDGAGDAEEMEMEVTTATLTVSSTTTTVDKGKERAMPPIHEQQQDEASSSSNNLAPPKAAAGRASSQPLRSTRAGSRGPTPPASTAPPKKRTRAGSAGAVGPSRAAPRNAATGLPTVREASDLPAMVETTTATIQQTLGLVPTPAPAPVDRFVSYPLPTDPVKELKALTHFDSGSEFLGTESKQKYRTDWHEGVVFDDPWDAATMARRRDLVAPPEESGLVQHEEGDEEDIGGIAAMGIESMVGMVGGAGDGGFEIGGAGHMSPYLGGGGELDGMEMSGAGMFR